MKLFYFLVVLFVAVVYAAVDPKCLQPTDPGTGGCMFHIVRYTYNAANGTCEPFIWRGCPPNSNNFVTMADCRRTCTP
ncbi:hypothetical protein PYW08_011207 [Mythimna loreyi]|uniref:Uncharacterized protein n=1 Tax=Mythimna loreyi TaxID=667449 RepID=A0ACC2Q3A5_9NEOP|nr:hypothetical protein PYW08_011207 [Mythimna loreyi]